MTTTEPRTSGRGGRLSGSGGVKVDVGEKANALLASPEFREDWTALHADCPWATVFQTPAFVLTWYRVYAARYEPLIIYSRGRTGRLEGLLLLARSRETGEVVNAGSIHAEYHAWLARRANQQTFPVAAMSALRAVAKRGSLTFLFLAHDAPLEWVPAAEAKGTFVSIRAHTRGLMRVGPNSDVPASFRKSSNKSRIARLKRIAGPVTFELLTTVEQLREIIGVVAEQSDVRHGGRSAFLPFRADPLKAQLYLELMAEPGLVHATVLRAGTEIIATHIGLRDKEPALGLMTHAPQFGAHSPGKLLLLHLGKLLGEEGYTIFDLTPGRRYKERFASHFDDVSVLEVFLDRASHRRFRAKRVVANVGKWLVTAVGRDPKASLRRLARISARIRRAGPLKLARMAIELALREANSTREFRIYEFALADRIGEPADLGRMRVNSLRDLLDYSPASPSDPPIIEFLETAERRLANGNLLFSYAEGGKLLHYGWLIPAADWMGSEFGHDIPLREKPTVLWDDFTHPSARGRGLHGESLRARLSYIAAHELSPTAMIGVRSDNAVSRHNIEAAGFTFAGSAWISTRLGKVRRWVQWEDPARRNYESVGRPERRGAETRDE